MQKNQDKSIYNVDDYSDNELFDMLDLTNPTDHELEAKIIMMIKRYSEEPSGSKLEAFFEDVYSHFFETEEDDNDEYINDTSSENDNQNNLVEGFTGADTVTLSLAQGSEAPTLTKGENKSKKSRNPVSLQNTMLQNTNKPAQTTQLTYGPSKLNPLLKETQKRVVHLDSQYRNVPVYPSSTNYTINLSDPLLNAVSLKLHSVNIPYTWYNVSNVYNANYFYLIGSSPEVQGTYNFKFEVPVGTYDINGLITALQQSISQVIADNPDVNFGTTNIALEATNATNSPYILKPIFTIDIQIVYNECNYYLNFPNNPINPFNSTIQPQNIPSFLGFSNSIYSLTSIYSNFEDAYLATGVINGPSPAPLIYNPFNANSKFNVVINDASNAIQGNNYFTIYNYLGLQDFDISNSTILDTIVVSFLDISGQYSRSQIVSNVNSALKSNPYLTSESYLQSTDITYTDNSNNQITMQRYELVVELNRDTTHKMANMKQIVVFPNENAIFPKIWTGQGSCFMFNQNAILCGLNNVISETSPAQTLYQVDSNPVITFKCTKPYYTKYNNALVIIPNSIESGYPDGYTLNSYIGVQTINSVNPNQYKNSAINQALAYIPFQNGSYGSYIIAEMFYSLSDNTVHATVDILQSFDQSTYILDISQCFLSTIFGLTSPIDVDCPCMTNVFDILFCVEAPLYTVTITSSNNKLIVYPKTSPVCYGNVNVPPYTIYFPVGTYSISRLQTMINNTFVSIQGTVDKQGNPLNGLNMEYTTVQITLDDCGNVYGTFTYVITNQLTENDYIVKFQDAYESSIYPTNTSWDYYLGITNISYVLNNALYSTEFGYAEINGLQLVYDDHYIDITSGTYSNNIFEFSPLPTAKGLYGANIVIEITPGSYTKYELYSAINYELSLNPLTNGSIISSYFDTNDQEYALFQININKIYTAQDFTLQNFTPSMFPLHQTDVNGNLSLKPTMWDVTIGWQLGFHSYQTYGLSPNNPNNANYVSQNAYTYDQNTNIVTLTADSALNLNIFNNFYIILNDYTQNHLNDGLITAATPHNVVIPSTYANPATYNLPANYTNQNMLIPSLDDSDNPYMLITQAQTYAASEIINNNNPPPPAYSLPPYLKDMFALVPLKLNGLNPGQTYMEAGGMLQDNDRKFFGPVNITRVTIQLVNDHGDIMNLNGANWSFSLVCEYLYTITRE